MTAQATQARLADNATQMFAWSCVLSKLDQMIANGVSGAEWEHAKASGLHFMDLAHERIQRNVRELSRNPDASMRRAAAAAYAFMDTLPDADVLHPRVQPDAPRQGPRGLGAVHQAVPGDRRALRPG